LNPAKLPLAQDKIRIFVQPAHPFLLRKTQPEQKRNTAICVFCVLKTLYSKFPPFLASPLPASAPGHKSVAKLSWAGAPPAALRLGSLLHLFHDSGFKASGMGKNWGIVVSFMMTGLNAFPEASIGIVFENA
jgi:hypothetical protein